MGKAGAELVSDVIPFEEMKLRMLNGSHSFRPTGYLAGYQHINECMEDEHYRVAAHALMLNEQAPTLKVKGVDLERYAELLIARYSNPALRHRTGKLRWTAARSFRSGCWILRAGTVHQTPFPLLALGVAGWMRYVGGVDEQGNAIDVSDPQLAVIQAAVKGSAEGENRVNALLGIEAILGKSCREKSLHRCRDERVSDAAAEGAKTTVAEYVSHL